jgi:hypothetical protein
LILYLPLRGSFIEKEKSNLALAIGGKTLELVF